MDRRMDRWRRLQYPICFFFKKKKAWGYISKYAGVGIWRKSNSMGGGLKKCCSPQTRASTKISENCGVRP